ncbi:MAG: lipopolysaccharide biosynthesis protein [Prevotellaceae bacterium]|jgi:O-antigen/teichoic acid export membrane protein|nr:lipopolysaccharide biosynthesis protein [Prevotellaceae bacterium]
MTQTLKEKTASALAWNTLDRFGQQILYMVTGIILARILNQHDYALIGMITIFTVISSILIDSGFVTSLIREKDVKDIDLSTVFVFNITIGIILYIILFLSAPLIARFFNQPSLSCISRVLFISLPVNALGIVQNAMLAKRLQFHKTAKINLTAVILSGTVSIVLAVTGYGVWALVAQILIFSVIRVILFWIWGDWKLSLTFSIQSFKRIFPFSINLLGANLLTAIMNNIYASTIGKFYTLTQTGNYAQAAKYADTSSTLMVTVIQGAMYPVLSSISDDEERLKRASRKTIRTMSFLLFPIIFGLVCIAKPLIVVLLTTKWEGAVPYFQLLCIASIFIPLSNINNNFLNVKGYSHIVFRIEIFRFITIITAMMLTLKLGIINMLIGLTVTRAVCYTVNAVYAGRNTGYSFWEQCKDMLPYIAISFVMSMLMYAVNYLTANLYILLPLQSITGLVFYIAANKMLGSKIYEDVSDLLKKALLIKKK